MDLLSSAARLYDTSSFMRIIDIIVINGHPTSGLAIHRWGSNTFSDQIRFLKPNLFSDAPRNVLTGVNALNGWTNLKIYYTSSVRFEIVTKIARGCARKTSVHLYRNSKCECSDWFQIAKMYL